jgi:predicted nucleic-acid-binding protein
LCELAWVLISGYGYGQQDALRALEQILRVTQFRAESPQIVWQALADTRKGQADFSDYLLGRANRANGCEYTATFDKKAGKHEIFRLIRIE